MRARFKTGWKKLGGSIAISLALHGVVALALLVTLSVPEMDQQQEEDVVEVTLVPPPPAPEDTLPEEEPVAEEAPPEEEAAPEEEALEVSPPEEPAVEEAQPEVPLPEEEVEVAEAEQNGAAGAEDGVPFPVLRPVFQFGEEESGPEVSPDGNAPELAQTEEEPAPTEEPLAEPVTPPQDIAALDDGEVVLLPEMLPEPAEADQPAAEAENKTPEPQETVPPLELTEARELFSTTISDNPAAVTAMGDMPRSLRGSELCTTELREQLRNAPTRYVLELLPAYRLESGNQLDVRDAAFKANGQWYNVAFRCTVDDDAMRVLGFALTIGDAIPPSQWQERGFPMN
ncbi:DUF930 domain-containing protein [Peteryoungia desertarenae]|uniref:DUF930 domain-containing protein n=1 Tax=Peteryoungia desertarenae TaxID=1813451 RepID=A0ABX6QQS2_9HYPH|nr:DUF930 domain-containing protein [Peteryoungia desertarenae]QLF70908.1 DUF930 domain-containing protein [Peteryoungia desertarenae]